MMTYKCHLRTLSWMPKISRASVTLLQVQRGQAPDSYGKSWPLRRSLCGENPKAIVILIQEPSFSDPFAVHKPSSATTILWLVILWVGDAWGTVCPTVGAGSRGWQPVFSWYLDQLSHSMAVPSKADRAEATRGRPRPGPVSLLHHPAVQAGQEASDISRGREIGSSPARKVASVWRGQGLSWPSCSTPTAQACQTACLFHPPVFRWEFPICWTLCNIVNKTVWVLGSFRILLSVGNEPLIR